MPRPGPRPYECVRRAWHSDRHQPMRGSFIKEIFRVANEIHSSATKKNKEWQEKLPGVVFKAEKIMYSKANSEAEYMDVKTLWNRANDAIDTIIRKEESTETGEILQPCIEAALILGCTARKASRSQRNSNPRCYLSPKTQESSSLPPRVPESATQGWGSLELPHSGNSTSLTQFISYCPNVPRSMTVNSTQLGPESCSPATLDYNPTIHQENPLSFENLPPFVDNQIFPTTTSPSLNLGRVYPLHYGILHQTTRPQFGFQTPQSSHSNTAVFYSPNVQSIAEPSMKGFLPNFFTRDEPVNASNRITQADLRNKPENLPQIDCDLSLRLASAPFGIAKTSLVQGAEDVRSSSSREGSKSGDRSPRIDKELCFFPRKNADDPLESCSRKWSSRGEGLNSESPSRKRKEPVRISEEDARFAHQGKFYPDLFFSRMKKPDA